MSVGEQLCLSCGLCCDGTIFGNVTLQPGDSAARLQSLGLTLTSLHSRPKFQQPCVAFDGCCCRIYAERPTYCRKFECFLFKEVEAGHLETSKARRIIRLAKLKAKTARRLLLELGDADEHLALSARFRRTSKRLAETALDKETAELFAQLTQVVHGLNLLVAESFYPVQPRLPAGREGTILKHD